MCRGSGRSPERPRARHWSSPGNKISQYQRFGCISLAWAREPLCGANSTPQKKFGEKLGIGEAVMMPRTNCTKAGGTPMSEKRFPSEPQMMLEADKRWAGRHSLRHHLSVMITYRHGLRVSEAFSLRPSVAISASCRGPAVRRLSAGVTGGCRRRWPRGEG